MADAKAAMWLEPSTQNVSGPFTFTTRRSTTLPQNFGASCFVSHFCEDSQMMALESTVQAVPSHESKASVQKSDSSSFRLVTWPQEFGGGRGKGPNEVPWQPPIESETSMATRSYDYPHFGHVNVSFGDNDGSLESSAKSGMYIEDDCQDQPSMVISEGNHTVFREFYTRTIVPQGESPSSFSSGSWTERLLHDPEGGNPASVVIVDRVVRLGDIYEDERIAQLAGVLSSPLSTAANASSTPSAPGLHSFVSIHERQIILPIGSSHAGQSAGYATEPPIKDGLAWIQRSGPALGDSMDCFRGFPV